LLIKTYQESVGKWYGKIHTLRNLFTPLLPIFSIVAITGVAAALMQGMISVTAGIIILAGVSVVLQLVKREWMQSFQMLLLRSSTKTLSDLIQDLRKLNLHQNKKHFVFYSGQHCLS